MAQAVLVELFSKTKYQNDLCLRGAHDYSIPDRAFHEGSHTQIAALGNGQPHPASTPAEKLKS